MSRDSSRENSSTDLASKNPQRKKNVHFDEERGESASQPQPSETKNSLFFLHEDDQEEVNDVPMTPFKKTGKIKTVSNVRVPTITLESAPFNEATEADHRNEAGSAVTMRSRTATRLAERRGLHNDIPTISLSPVDLSYVSARSSYEGGITPMSRAASTPGTPAEGLLGMFGPDTPTAVHGSMDDLTSMNLSNHGSTENDGLVPDLSDEHRRLNLEAYKLVRAHTIQHEEAKRSLVTSTPNSARTSLESADNSISEAMLRERLEGLAETQTPKKTTMRGGVLSNLMQLYNSTIYHQPPPVRSQGSSASGTSTPKWHQRHSQSNASLNALLGAGQSLGSVVGMHAHSRNNSAISLVELDKSQRPNLKKMRKHSGGLRGIVQNSFNRPRLDAELRITLAIADVLQRQKFIIKLCKSLMLFGAPTHRLEDYLKLTARALEIDAQFLYIPGCMIVAFDDKTTHTTDVKIVRVTQGTDLGKLNEVHFIYKNVLHAVTNVDQGIIELDQQLDLPQLYSLGFVLFAYGLAAVCVGPFAFQSSFIDLPIQFLLGLFVGVLQLVVAPRSQLYANVFEILATICVSFLGRGFGSIPKKDGSGTVFCFAALTQSSIALILPGYMVLCGALELQSKSIVAGSVRLFYAIVYSLFLSFGITIGSVLYGWLDSNATQATTCTSNISDWYRFLFVPGFAACLLVVNQAKPRQAPVALLIASAGYATNYFTNKKFGVAQVSNAIGAFVIGCLGNLYSRIGHGLAFTAVLPSIFVQVPSGLASGSSLVSGLALANSILNNTDGNATSGTTTSTGTGALEFGYEMIQIAIGITVGLFASALVIYIPLCGAGKRTGMLTF